jgi:hypothetical protein
MFAILPTILIELRVYLLCINVPDIITQHAILPIQNSTPLHNLKSNNKLQIIKSNNLVVTTESNVCLSSCSEYNVLFRSTWPHF